MFAKTPCISLALIIVLASTLTLAQTQTRCFPKSNAKENALQLVGMKTGFLPATESLLKMGIEFYDFSIISSNLARIRIYDKSKQLLDTVELSTDVSDNSLLYKIYSTNAEDAWVRVKNQLVGAEYLFIVTSSNGGTMKIRVTTKPTQSQTGRTESI